MVERIEENWLQYFGCSILVLLSLLWISYILLYAGVLLLPVDHTEYRAECEPIGLVTISVYKDYFGITFLNKMPTSSETYKMNEREYLDYCVNE